jgi:hypothetical protein
MRLLAPNKHELWIALGLVAIGFLVFRTHMPLGPVDTIGFAISVLIAWVLSVNAALDFKRMDWPLRIWAVFWLLLVTWLAWQALLPEFSSDRHWATS